jgi:hypothetical protein
LSGGYIGNRAGGWRGTALQQRPHYSENQKEQEPDIYYVWGAVFTSRDIVMLNGPMDNGNQMLCKRSLVTRLEGSKIVTGNGERGF